MEKPANYIYEFGDFRLETAERLLLRAGKPVPLTPKVFETLVALIDNRGRLVRKDDLIRRIWPDAIVEEANLARNVWALRKALGDAEGEDFIETIPKTGYRFRAPVRAIESPDNAIVTVPTPVTTETSTAPVPSEQHAPAAGTALWRPGLLAAALLIVVVLTSLSVSRVRDTAEVRRATKPGIMFLTDGSHDDSAPFWAKDGRINFSRSASANRIETWTMDGDGTNPRRANTNIHNLLAGRWSPDGTKVIFVKDDGRQTTYLADADGSHEIALPFTVGNLDWAPDGSRFVYQSRTSTGADLFLYTLATATNVNLTNGGSSADPSFSYDGARIAFTSFRDDNPEIYVMDADGSNVRRVTNHPAFDNYPVFSPDGTQLAFQSNREDEHVEVYLQNLNDDSPPRRLTTSGGFTGFAPKSWSADGSKLLVYANDGGNSRIAVIDVDPFPSELLLSDDSADLAHPTVSRDGRRLLHEAHLSDGSIEIRVTQLDTKRTESLFRSEPGYPVHFPVEPIWSPDESLIAFTARVKGNSEVFLMKADGSQVRNLTNNPLIDLSPSFLADGRTIVFARDAYGQAQLYRMDLDGRNQHRLTDKPGHEMNPASSPDGVHLAFAGDREARGLDILLLDLNQPAQETRLIARRAQDGSPAFSPDGRRLVFLATGDGNAEIYVMNADGSGLFRVTRTPTDEAGPRFFRDADHIVFSSARSGRSSLYQINLRSSAEGTGR